MPGNADERGPDKDRPDDDSLYLIDETVELEDLNGRQGYVWEIEEDMDPESEYVVRAISRASGSFRVHILPVEEAEAFKEGENFWPEWTSDSGDKISSSVSVDTDDENPYFHSGDLRLAIEQSSRNTGDITMKFREIN